MVENNERGNYLWNNFRCNTLEHSKKFRVNLGAFSEHLRCNFAQRAKLEREWEDGGGKESTFSVGSTARV